MRALRPRRVKVNALLGLLKLRRRHRQLVRVERHILESESPAIISQRRDLVVGDRVQNSNRGA